MWIFLLGACFGEIEKRLGDTGEVVDDADAPADTGDTGDTGADTGAGDDDTGVTAPDTWRYTGIVVEWSPSDGDLTTRDHLLAEVGATRTDEDGVEVVTDRCAFVSSDEGVLKFYAPGVGQPLDAGSAQIAVSCVLGDRTFSADPFDVRVAVAAAAAGDLVVNELLADVPSGGDPNGDGASDDVEDEFLELANVSDVTVDLSGVAIVETDFPTLPRHTFPSGTVLRAGEAVVVFGGGAVSRLSEANVQFFVADNEDHSLQYGLSLRNAGEAVEIVAADGRTIASIGYGDSGAEDAVQDASLVLSPDVWGTRYADHSGVSGSTGDYSPGTWADGTAFEGPDARYAN